MGRALLLLVGRVFRGASQAGGGGVVCGTASSAGIGGCGGGGTSDWTPGPGSIAGERGGGVRCRVTYWVKKPTDDGGGGSAIQGLKCSDKGSSPIPDIEPDTEPDVKIQGHN